MTRIQLEITPEDYKTLLDLTVEGGETLEEMLVRWLSDLAADERGEPVK